MKRRNEKKFLWSFNVNRKITSRKKFIVINVKRTQKKYFFSSFENIFQKKYLTSVKMP